MNCCGLALAEVLSSTDAACWRATDGSGLEDLLARASASRFADHAALRNPFPPTSDRRRHPQREFALPSTNSPPAPSPAGTVNSGHHRRRHHGAHLGHARPRFRPPAR